MRPNEGDRIERLAALPLRAQLRLMILLAVTVVIIVWLLELT